jgi:hypothetical protein
MLSGELAVLQAPMFDGLSLDPFAQFDDGRCRPCRDEGRIIPLGALHLALSNSRYPIAKVRS